MQTVARVVETECLLPKQAVFPGHLHFRPAFTPLLSALSFFLEACGKVVLERAGAILEERVTATPG